jgi:hypothetical protein
VTASNFLVYAGAAEGAVLPTDPGPTATMTTTVDGSPALEAEDDPEHLKQATLV